MEKKRTVTTTIRIPIELRQRIDVLAHKRMCSVNMWIRRTLEREAMPREVK
jgi:predicted DNA-binding protein